MISQGSEPPLPGDRTDLSADPACDDAFTRLLLLLEIADGPDWLREVARPDRTPAQQGDPGRRSGR